MQYSYNGSVAKNQCKEELLQTNYTPPGQPPNMSVVHTRITKALPIYHQKSTLILCTGTTNGTEGRDQPEDQNETSWPKVILFLFHQSLLLLLMSYTAPSPNKRVSRAYHQKTSPPLVTVSTSSIPSHYQYSPEIWAKHCVSVATVNPLAKAVAKSTDETLAPTPDPAAAPHTMNTYRNEAKHSEIMDLRGSKGQKSGLINNSSSDHIHIRLEND